MEILLADTIHPVFNTLVARHGYTCVDGTKLSRDEIMHQRGGYAGMAIRSRFPVDEPFLEAMEGLKFVARAGAGLEQIDMEAARRLGIRVVNAPEGNRNAVAEHALGMLLALLNNLHRADREVRRGQWNRESNRGRELDGKTVGIIGFGHTGSAFTRKLAGFEVEVLACDPYKTIGRKARVRQAGMDELAAACDVISLHVPLTPETEFMVDRDFLGSLARKPVLINTSRGRVVKTTALLGALSDGTVSGACLDVFDFEDSSFENTGPADAGTFEQLVASERVILSPHIAGWSMQSYEKISRVLAEKVAGLGL